MAVFQALLCIWIHLTLNQDTVRQKVHFIMEETEAQRGKVMAKTTESVREQTLELNSGNLAPETYYFVTH